MDVFMLLLLAAKKISTQVKTVYYITASTLPMSLQVKTIQPHFLTLPLEYLTFDLFRPIKSTNLHRTRSLGLAFFNLVKQLFWTPPLSLEVMASWSMYWLPFRCKKKIKKKLKFIFLFKIRVMSIEH